MFIFYNSYFFFGPIHVQKYFMGSEEVFGRKNVL